MLSISKPENYGDLKELVMLRNSVWSSTANLQSKLTLLILQLTITNYSFSNPIAFAMAEVYHRTIY
jgi:hypothetical protein